MISFFPYAYPDYLKVYDFTHRSFQFLSFNTKLSFSALKLPEATTPFFILIEQMQKVVQNQVHLYTNSLVCTTHTCFSKEYF